MQAYVDILSESDCLKDWGSSQWYSGRVGNQICVHDRFGDDGRSSTCRGDSGGPLAVMVEGNYEVWGATSYGKALPCWLANALGHGSVFAMVYGVRDWIEEVSGGSCPRE